MQTPKYPDLNGRLELDEAAMRTYGYQVVDAIVQHFVTQREQLPVATGNRAEMDSLFQETAPDAPTPPEEVLHFVLDHVMTRSNIVSHPRSYAFVPRPSNYISAMSDALTAGFNIFSGG
ncbi:MAG: hypothetical protein R2795_11110 [Saprospiraceae bacterium]